MSHISISIQYDIIAGGCCLLSLCPIDGAIDTIGVMPAGGAARPSDGILRARITRLIGKLNAVGADVLHATHAETLVANTSSSQVVPEISDHQ